MDYEYNLELKGFFSSVVTKKQGTWLIPFWFENIQDITSRASSTAILTDDLRSNLIDGDPTESTVHNVFLKKADHLQVIEQLEKEMQIRFHRDGLFDLSDIPVISASPLMNTETLLTLAQDDRILGVRPLNDPKSEKIETRLKQLVKSLS